MYLTNTIFLFICCLGISGLILLASQINPTKSGITISDSLQNMCFNFFLLALVIVFFHFGQDVKTSLEKERELTFETIAIQVLKGKVKGMHYLDIGTKLKKMENITVLEEHHI
jgi:hypothetical protein